MAFQEDRHSTTGSLLISYELILNPDNPTNINYQPQNPVCAKYRKSLDGWGKIIMAQFGTIWALFWCRLNIQKHECSQIYLWLFYQFVTLAAIHPRLGNRFLCPRLLFLNTCFLTLQHEEHEEHEESPKDQRRDRQEGCDGFEEVQGNGQRHESTAGISSQHKAAGVSSKAETPRSPSRESAEAKPRASDIERWWFTTHACIYTRAATCHIWLHQAPRAQHFRTPRTRHEYSGCGLADNLSPHADSSCTQTGRCNWSHLQ